MIEAKEAVLLARQKAVEMLELEPYRLEEIELETYKGHEVWNITLSFPRDLEALGPLQRISAEPLDYKRFLVDAETGNLVAMKLRELAGQ